MQTTERNLSQNQNNSGPALGSAVEAEKNKLQSSQWLWDRRFLHFREKIVIVQPFVSDAACESRRTCRDAVGGPEPWSWSWRALELDQRCVSGQGLASVV